MKKKQEKKEEKKKKSRIKRFVRRLSLSSSRLYSKSRRLWIKQQLIFGGMEVEHDYLLGKIILIGIILSIIPPLITYFLINELFIYALIVGAVILPASQGLLISIIQLKVLSRSRQVEKHLPDFLRLIAANARSGMTPFAAMRNAARKEFTVLSKETKKATLHSLGSESYEKVLNYLTQNIDSIVLKRVVQLLATGMKTGGDIPELLEGTAEEIMKTQALKKELVTSVKSYMMFIIIIITFGLPFLLVISIFFVQTITSLQGLVGDSEFTPTAVQILISLDYLYIMSPLVILFTVLFASLLMGSIVEGKFIQGLKYFPILLGVSLGIYFAANIILPLVLGQLIV